MAHQVANKMASAMAVVSERNMAHSTPLHSTTFLAVACGVFGQSLHASHGDLGACDALAPLAGVIA